MGNVYDFQSFKNNMEEEDYEKTKQKAITGARNNLNRVLGMIETLYIDCDENSEEVQKHGELCLEELAFLTREFIGYMCQYFEFDEKAILERARKAKSLNDIVKEAEERELWKTLKWELMKRNLYVDPVDEYEGDKRLMLSDVEGNIIAPIETINTLEAIAEWIKNIPYEFTDEQLKKAFESQERRIKEWEGKHPSPAQG